VSLGDLTKKLKGRKSLEDPLFEYSDKKKGEKTVTSCPRVQGTALILGLDLVEVKKRKRGRLPGQARKRQQKGRRARARGGDEISLTTTVQETGMVKQLGSKSGRG